MAESNVFLFGTNIFVILLCGVLFAIMPRLTRKSYLFGVKIPPEHADSPEALALRRQYEGKLKWGFSFILAVCVAQYFLWPDLTLLATMYLPLLMLPRVLSAFVPNWKKAIRLKEEKGWHVPQVLFAETKTSHTQGALSALPWIWYAFSFLLVSAAFVISIARFPLLPDMIPGHMDANMQVTRMVDKTWWSVLVMPIVSAATLALMFAVGILVEKAKMQVDWTKPQVSFAQHRIYRRRMGHALGALTFFLMLFMLVSGLPIIFPDSPFWGAHIFWGGMAMLNIAVAALIVVQVKSGQGGCKIAISDVGDACDACDAYRGAHGEAHHAGAAAEAAVGVTTRIVGGRGDDRHWVLGLFYYNPDDPVYFIEDRFGTNFGFNYARLPVKVGVAALLFGLIVMYGWLTVQFI